MGKLVIGVDEAGRGALAGPVAVGAFSVEEGSLRMVIERLRLNISELRDSKMLSPKKRDEIFGRLKDLRSIGLCDYRVVMVGNSVINDRGINAAVSIGIRRVLQKISPDKNTNTVLLDGLLKAPRRFKDQRTIIGGDTKEWSIALASVVVKVKRDAYMCRVALKYRGYGFEKHKGYGTREHFSVLKNTGLCDLHREGYLRGLASRLE
jgi:ribonuclease HII